MNEGEIKEKKDEKKKNQNKVIFENGFHNTPPFWVESNRNLRFEFDVEDEKKRHARKSANGQAHRLL